MQRTSNRVVRILALALLAQVAMSWALWYPWADRTFPLLPVWREAAAPIVTWDWILPFVLVLPGILLLVLFPGLRWLIGAVSVLSVLLVVQDQNRLQPWLYFYLLVFLIHLGSAGDNHARLRHWQWLLAAVYAWGGFNKLTPYFAVDNFPWFCEAFSWTKPMGQLPALGYATALAELLFAPGLLWSRSRAYFRWIVPGFHLFIVVALSPVGLNWNMVVIPWNIAMGAMVWYLFDPQLKPERASSGNSSRIVLWAVQGLAWIMPLFNVFHIWDEALSWKMYSNTQAEASYFSLEVPCARMDRVWNKYAYDDKHKLLLSDWTMEELNVPVYDSKRTHQQIARYLCKCRDFPGSGGLLRLQVERWNRNAESWEEIPCTILLEK
ncbi:MAG: hypothetical protein EP344_06800 [Bacteroidetes bacterium]|nr:MAG: hypothetical protein EP344_06800 [Bacteroidota bacterium]